MKENVADKTNIVKSVSFVASKWGQLQFAEIVIIFFYFTHDHRTSFYLVHRKTIKQS